MIIFLQGAGFKVVDIGVDVPPDRFVTAAAEHQASLIGISVLLTGCYPDLKRTVAAIREAGLAGVKVMVGGNYVDETVRQDCGADYCGGSTADAVAIAKKAAGNFGVKGG